MHNRAHSSPHGRGVRVVRTSGCPRRARPCLRRAHCRPRTITNASPVIQSSRPACLGVKRCSKWEDESASPFGDVPARVGLSPYGRTRYGHDDGAAPTRPMKNVELINARPRMADRGRWPQVRRVERRPLMFAMGIGRGPGMCRTQNAYNTTLMDSPSARMSRNQLEMNAVGTFHRARGTPGGGCAPSVRREDQMSKVSGR
jgi:hypothetical protein